MSLGSLWVELASTTAVAPSDVLSWSQLSRVSLGLKLKWVVLVWDPLNRRHRVNTS